MKLFCLTAFAVLLCSSCAGLKPLQEIEKTPVFDASAKEIQAVLNVPVLGSMLNGRSNPIASQMKAQN